MIFQHLLTTLHPATVHFPIALLLVASVAGLLYLYWQPHNTLLILTWWPMRLGWLGAAAAVLTGLLAQRGLPPQAPYLAILNWHIGTGLALLVNYGLLLYQAWVYDSARSTKARLRRGINATHLLDDRQARLLSSLLLVAGLVLLFASGWNGGRLVYEWGVNVLR
ncbi:MAG: hypothetical protein NT075_17945 [Chloroflexi bacterium]|nr:hypothetical protein [Chloroflexota bacterium]